MYQKPTKIHIFYRLIFDIFFLNPTKFYKVSSWRSYKKPCQVEKMGVPLRVQSTFELNNELNMKGLRLLAVATYIDLDLG